MARNTNLTRARVAAKDEFYTQYADIEREMNAYLDYDPDVFRGKTVLLPCNDPEWSNFTRYFVFNFTRLGLKKLISISYAPKSCNETLDLFSHVPEEAERASPHFDAECSLSKGRLLVLTGDSNQDKAVDMNDIHWTYLEGDGDFRSPEVTALRDEADIIITNPPFSLFRLFISWVGEKYFIIVGHQNAITYKEVFPLIKDNRIWLGLGFKGGAGFFINKYYENYARAAAKEEGKIRVSGVMWFTNIEHGRRHQPLSLDTMANNLHHHKKMKGKTDYDRYDNYDAIDVPYTGAIPSDYGGVMGVPISFLGKYCPEQFEIIKFRKGNDGKDLSVNGQFPYFRILIRHKS